MIAKARDRKVYDELKVGDVTSILMYAATRQDEALYDLVVACDVFVYLGDLSIVLA